MQGLQARIMMSIVLLLAAAASQMVLVLPLPAAAAAAVPLFGAAGHFAYQVPYGRDQPQWSAWPINTTEQLRVLREACGGAHPARRCVYKTDFPCCPQTFNTTSNSSDIHLGFMVGLVDAAARQGIEVMGAVGIGSAWGAAAGGVGAEEYGRRMATVLRGKGPPGAARHWQLSDEWAVDHCMLPRVDYKRHWGMDKADYNASCMTGWAATMTKVMNGIHSVTPSAVCMPVSMGWTRLGIWQWLSDERVPLDAIGLDWYSDGGDINCTCTEYPPVSCGQPGHKPCINFLDRLDQLFSAKPVFITEMNRKLGSCALPPVAAPPGSTCGACSQGDGCAQALADQVTYVASALDKYEQLAQAGHNIGGVVYYELLDQPHLCSSTTCSSEALYGLVRVERDNATGALSLGTQKPVMAAIRAWNTVAPVAAKMDDDENGRSSGDDGATSCVGYVVSGAGAAEVNGCYVGPGGAGSNISFANRANGIVLSRNPNRRGAWQFLNRTSGRAFYVQFTSPTVASTALPPVSTVPVTVCSSWVWPLGWTCSGKGRPPQPAVTRMGLPPVPPPPLDPPSPPAPSPPPPPAMELVMAEDFSGSTINHSRWRVYTGVHHGGIYELDNVMLRNGSLVLQTVAKNQSVGGTDFFVSSGAVNQSGLLEQRFGRWSARVKLPAVDASPGWVLHSSVWLVSNHSNPSSSGCHQEIDIVEQYAAGLVPSLDSTAAGALHASTGTAAAGTCKAICCGPQAYLRTADFHSDFHVFTLDWSATRISISIDNVTVLDYTESAVVASFTDQQFLALTSCVMNRVPPSAGDSFPLIYEVDWVRVHRWKSDDVVASQDFEKRSAPATNGWHGPIDVTYSDKDCPNVGCHGPWPGVPPNDPAPCESICNSVNGCNATVVAAACVPVRRASDSHPTTPVVVASHTTGWVPPLLHARPSRSRASASSLSASGTGSTAKFHSRHRHQPRHYHHRHRHLCHQDPRFQYHQGLLGRTRRGHGSLYGR